MLGKDERLIKEVHYGSQKDVGQERILILTNHRLLLLEEETSTKQFRLRSLKRSNIAGLELNTEAHDHRSVWLIAGVLLLVIAFLLGRMATRQSEFLMLFGFDTESMSTMIVIGFLIAILIVASLGFIYHYFKDVSASYELIVHLNHPIHETMTFENGMYVGQKRKRLNPPAFNQRFYPSETLKEDILDLASLLVE